MKKMNSSSVNMDQQYVLRWNKHHENLSDGVISYFERGLMCDVTITVGPRQKLKAHQAILSACSPYFESIFTENTHQNVTVMMVNVDHDILKAIIEYMYKGEVNIAQKLLPDFLKTAAHFQVKGLVDPENISQNADYDQHLPSSASPPIPPSDNDIVDRKRPHIEHRNSLITERFDEHESDSMHRDFDSTNENDNRTELSPILNEHIRKRRKDSICDNPLPHKRLHLRTPESNASSHSSYKISPLPKSNSNDVDAEGKRKSPNANQLQQPSIKQEEQSDAAGSPQVHLSTTPNLYTHGSGPPPPQFPGPDDILNSVGLHPNHEPENEQPIPHIEPGNEIDGAEGVAYSHHKSPPNGNYSAYPMLNDEWKDKIHHNMQPSSFTFPKFSSLTAMPMQVTNRIYNDSSREWDTNLPNLPRSPDYERRHSMKGPTHQPMSYHNMFIPSSEPGTLWKCRSCGKEVTNRWHHFHSHTAQRSLCPYCPATYSRIDTLRSHLKQKHRNEHHHKGS